MTAPKRLTLAPLAIPIEWGMVAGSAAGDDSPRYRFGIDERGTLYLTYQHWGDSPRLSVSDPHWNAHHGLRYIDWVTLL